MVDSYEIFVLYRPGGEFKPQAAVNVMNVNVGLDSKQG
jgi:hypothetical protein